VTGAITLDGEPTSGVVSAFAEGDDESRYYGWSDGRYRLEELESGLPHRLVLQVNLPGRGNERLCEETVVIPRAGGTVEHDFALRMSSGGVEGTIGVGEGSSLWQLYAFEGANTASDPPRASSLLRATCHGKRSATSYRFPLPPGTYTLLARDLAPDDEGKPRLREDRVELVVIRGDETVNVDFYFR